MSWLNRNQLATPGGSVFKSPSLAKRLKRLPPSPSGVWSFSRGSLISGREPSLWTVRVFNDEAGGFFIEAPRGAGGKIRLGDDGKITTLGVAQRDLLAWLTAFKKELPPCPACER